MRLIDADAIPEVSWDPKEEAAFRSTIEEMPTIEAEPVRHGKCVDTGSGQECSVCGEIQYGYDSGRYYCSNCGAKMEKNNE